MNQLNLAKFVNSDGKYDLTIFSSKSIDIIENNIIEKGNKYFLTCLKRNKQIQQAYSI